MIVVPRDELARANRRANGVDGTLPSASSNGSKVLKRSRPASPALPVASFSILKRIEGSETVTVSTV